MTQKQAVPIITCENYWNREQEGEHPTTIDVRSKEEWDSGHIEHATHIPFEKIEEVDQIFPNKNAEIIICCARGKRSELAVNRLIAMGYTNAKSLSGGYSGYCGDEDNPATALQDELTQE